MQFRALIDNKRSACTVAVILRFHPSWEFLFKKLRIKNSLFIFHGIYKFLKFYLKSFS